MSKRPITSTLVVVAVAVGVAAVAWYRSEHAPNRTGRPSVTSALPHEPDRDSGDGSLASTPGGHDTPQSSPVGDTVSPSASAPVASAPTDPTRPRMVDLGADKCIPCKKMAPILAELKREYAGRAIIDFIDVWKDPAAGKPYNIRVIPTQIFYNRDGHEVWRHEGFLPKEQIVAKLAELGVK